MRGSRGFSVCSLSCFVDFSDRSIVEASQSKIDKGTIGIRNPYSTRPYQHVLEPDNVLHCIDSVCNHDIIILK